MQYEVNKLKIVHFIHKPFLAGAQRASLDILKSINPKGVDKYLLYANDLTIDEKLRNDFIKEFKDIGVITIPINSLKQSIGFKDFFTLIEVFTILRKIKPDIINTISSKPFLIGGIVSFILKIPIRIHTVQGLSWYRSMPFFKKYSRFFLEQLSMLLFTKIVFVNVYYSKYFPFQRHKSVYIPNGKKFDNLTQRVSDTNLIRILFLGRIDFQKDPLTLIKSFEEFLRNYEGKKKVFLDIVGDGPDRSYLEFVTNRSKVLSNRIIFHGWSNSVNTFLEKSDIFISTPVYEAFGFVFLEAANYYLPVIATNVEGIPEVVVNGHGGLLHESGDFKSISQSINTLVENDSLRHEYGKFHGEYCRKKYFSEKIEKLYKALYFTS